MYDLVGALAVAPNMAAIIYAIHCICEASTNIVSDSPIIGPRLYLFAIRCLTRYLMYGRDYMRIMPALRRPLT